MRGELRAASWLSSVCNFHCMGMAFSVLSAEGGVVNDRKELMNDKDEVVRREKQLSIKAVK